MRLFFRCRTPRLWGGLDLNAQPADDQHTPLGRDTEAARTRRLLGFACLFALLALCLAGCDLRLATPEPTPIPEEPEPTVTPVPTDAVPAGVTQLTFWEPFPLDRPQGLLLGEMIRDFETEVPTITVEIVAKAGYVGIHGAMLDGLSQAVVSPLDNELPDLAVAFPSMIAEYAQAGVVAPLDAYLYDPEIGLNEQDWVDLVPGTLETGRLTGFGRQLLAFPFAHNAIGMWVNQALLKQAGWDHSPTTWEEFEQACFDVMATSGTGCYPFVESVSTFNAWLYSRGGQQLDESGQVALFSGPEGVESLALLRRLQDAGLAWRPEEPYGDYVAFANGQAAFSFSSTGTSLLYQDAYEGAVQQGMAPFRWRQTLPPQGDPANPVTVLYGSSFFILRGDPDRERAAWHLIRWFTDTEQTARWASELQAMPVRTSALAVMTDTLETYPCYQAQVEGILPYGRPEPSVAEELEIRDLLYTAILSVTQGFSDPQTALDQAAENANRVLAGE